jgi:hypothetical protein
VIATSAEWKSRSLPVMRIETGWTAQDVTWNSKGVVSFFGGKVVLGENLGARLVAFCLPVAVKLEGHSRAR